MRDSREDGILSAICILSFRDLYSLVFRSGCLCALELRFESSMLRWQGWQMSVQRLVSAKAANKRKLLIIRVSFNLKSIEEARHTSGCTTQGQIQFVEWGVIWGMVTDINCRGLRAQAHKPNLTGFDPKAYAEAAGQTQGDPWARAYVHQL
jgi:hypothetical protein